MRRSVRWTTVVVAAIASFVGFASPASASSSSSGNVYQSNYDCTWVKALTNDPGQSPGYQTQMKATMVYTIGTITYECYQNFNRPGGNLAIKQDVVAWNGNQWVTCNTGGWIYSSSTASSMHTEWDAPPYGEPCGWTGYYGIYGYGYEYNGSWKGGSVWSGYVYK